MHSTLVVPPSAPLQRDEAMLARIEEVERAEAAATNAAIPARHSWESRNPAPLPSETEVAGSLLS
jgi:hypothetical protein